MISCSLKIACSRSFMHTHCMRWAFFVGISMISPAQNVGFQPLTVKMLVFCEVGMSFLQKVGFDQKRIGNWLANLKIEALWNRDTHNIDPKNLIGGLKCFNVLFQFFVSVHQPGVLFTTEVMAISGISHAPQIDRNAFFPWLSTGGSFLCI